MITGNHSPGMVVSSYSDPKQALALVDRFIARLSD
jgi:hypothetical protein